MRCSLDEEVVLMKKGKWKVNIWQNMGFTAFARQAHHQGRKVELTEQNKSK